MLKKKRAGSQSEWPQQDSNIKRKDIQLILAATSRRKRLVSISFLMTKVERLSCLSPSTECLFCLSHGFADQARKVSMANCNHLLWLVWATIIPKVKLIADAYMRAHACAYINKEWVGAVFLPEQT